MSEVYTYVPHDGSWASVGGQRYSREELRYGWENKAGQGNRQAREADPRVCFRVPCDDEEEALALSALMVRRVFAIPSCAWWDGSRFSFYCGDSGGSTLDLILRAQRIYQCYQIAGIDECGQLFTDPHPATINPQPCGVKP